MYELTIKGENPQSLREELKGLLSMFEVIQAPQVPVVATKLTVQTPPVQSVPQMVVPVITSPTTVPQPIPTTAVAQEYTLSQIQTAMGGLADGGKMNAIQQIMAEFGVGAVTDIPKERYGELVVRLRSEGAQI